MAAEVGSSEGSIEGSEQVVKNFRLLEKFHKDATYLELDNGTGVSTEILEYIAKKFPHLQSLSITFGYDHSNKPVLSFSELSFPKLKSLSLDGVGLRSLHFEKDNYPCLESISVENPLGDVPYVRLNLPTLTSFSCEFVDLENASGFAPSLSRCTSLKSFSSYKLWGLFRSRCNKLYLPSCKHFKTHRADNLAHLELYAPKLRYLNLQACYELRHVRIVEDPFGRSVRCFCCGKEGTEKESAGGEVDLKRCTRCRIAQYCSRECQEKHWSDHKAFCGRKIEVNLVNANIDSVSLQLLKKHPRIRKIRRNPDNLFF